MEKEVSSFSKTILSLNLPDKDICKYSVVSLEERFIWKTSVYRNTKVKGANQELEHQDQDPKFMSLPN